MNLDMYESAQQYQSALAAERDRDRIFLAYLDHLGVSREELTGKTILDGGCGHKPAFAIRARELGIACSVTSVDKGHIHASDELKEACRIIPDTAFEDLHLKDKFDFIFLHDTTPYTLVNENQDEEGKWKITDEHYEEWVEKLIRSIHGVIQNAGEHLAVGGKAIIYPIFPNDIVDFGSGNGGKKDFRVWRDILDRELIKWIETHQKNFTMKFEPGSGEDEDDPVVRERLIIERRK